MNIHSRSKSWHINRIVSVKVALLTNKQTLAASCCNQRSQRSQCARVAKLNGDKVEGEVALDQLQPQPLSNIGVSTRKHHWPGHPADFGHPLWHHLARSVFATNDADSTLAALRVVVYPCSIVLKHRFFNHMHGFLWLIAMKLTLSLSTTWDILHRGSKLYNDDFCSFSSSIETNLPLQGLCCENIPTIMSCFGCICMYVCKYM